MERLRRNVVANFLGIGITSGAPLLFNIAYFHLLGSEAYGLVGLFVTVHLIAVALDLGLSRTTTLEVARRSARAPSGIGLRPAVLTLLMVNAVLFFALASVVGALSPWIATSWLDPGGLDERAVIFAVALMGVSIALHQPRTILIAALNGLQRQVLANVLIGGAAVLRGAVTIAVLAASPTLVAFFWTQAIMAGLETLAIGIVVWRALPAAAHGTHARLDWDMLRKVSGFALADGTNVAIGTAIMNADKLVLSGIVPLQVFGTYGLLSLVAQSLARLPAPFTIAHFPRLVELQHGDVRHLADVYRRANVDLTRLLVPAATVVVAFAGPIAAVLLGNDVSLAHPGAVLALLATGCAAHALMHLPYSLQLSIGWTRLGLVTNAIVLVTYVPLLVRFVPGEGPVAAALLFLMAMVIPLPVFVQLAHRRLLTGAGGGARWWRIVVAAPIAVSCAIVTPVRVLSGAMPSWAALIAAVAAGLAALAAVRRVQERLLSHWGASPEAISGNGEDRIISRAEPT